MNKGQKRAGLLISCLSLSFFIIAFYTPKSMTLLIPSLLFLGIGSLANGLGKIYGETYGVFWSRTSIVFIILSIFTALGVALFPRFLGWLQ